MTKSARVGVVSSTLPTKEPCESSDIFCFVRRTIEVLDCIPRSQASGWQDYNQRLSELQNDIRRWDDAPLSILTLEDLTKELEEDEFFNTAVGRLDRSFCLSAVESMRTLYPYIVGAREISVPQRDIIVKQYGLTQTALLHQLDSSQMTRAVLSRIPDLFRRFSFATSKEFQEAESRLMSDFGITPQQIADICDLADQHKDQLYSLFEPALTATRAADPNTQAAPMVSACCAPERSASRSTSDAGTTLAGVNTALLLAPEPAISKILGGLSVLAGLIGCIFG